MSKQHYIIPIFVPHEGCPHNCVFCNQNAITGSENKVDAAFVRKTMEDYLKTIGNTKAIVEVSFFGGTFTAIDIKKQNELLSVAKEYKDLGKIRFIRLSTRPDYIDDNILTNLKNYGVDIIELGVQSLSDKVLTMSGRGHTAKDVYDASEKIKQYGFTLGHQIMPGLPGDDYKKDIDTVNQVISIKPDICRIYPSLVIKDTPMEEMYLHGTYKPYSLDKAVNISKELLGRLQAANITVIRVGLQPTEEINIGKELLAGPFHPAFKELVMASIYRDMICKNIPSNYSGHVVIKINSKEISKLYANKKQFFKKIIDNYKKCDFKVVQNDLIDRSHLVMKLNDQEIRLSMQKYFELQYKRGNQ